MDLSFKLQGRPLLSRYHTINQHLILVNYKKYSMTIKILSQKYLFKLKIKFTNINFSYLFN